MLLTMCHMGVCSIMAYAVSKMGITPKHQMKSTAQLYKVCRCISPLDCLSDAFAWRCQTRCGVHILQVFHSVLTSGRVLSVDPTISPA